MYRAKLYANITSICKHAFPHNTFHFGTNYPCFNCFVVRGSNHRSACPDAVTLKPEINNNKSELWLSINCSNIFPGARERNICTTSRVLWVYTPYTVVHLLYNRSNHSYSKLSQFYIISKRQSVRHTYEYTDILYVYRANELALNDESAASSTEWRRAYMVTG